MKACVPGLHVVLSETGETREPAIHIYCAGVKHFRRAAGMTDFLCRFAKEDRRAAVEIVPFVTCRSLERSRNAVAGMRRGGELSPVR